MDMIYNIIGNKVAQWFGLCLMVCIMCVSCTVDASDGDELYYDGLVDDSYLTAHIGVYEGNWTLDGQDAGAGVMSVYKDSISFDTLPQEAIAKRCTGNIMQDVTFEPVRYCVKYFLNGSSADTYYFTLESKSYQYDMKSVGCNSPVNVTMTTLYSDLPNAIYKKGTLVAMLKISQIVTHTTEGETIVSNYNPAMVLMFNPVKRIR